MWMFSTRLGNCRRHSSINNGFDREETRVNLLQDWNLLRCKIVRSPPYTEPFTRMSVLVSLLLVLDAVYILFALIHVYCLITSCTFSDNVSILKPRSSTIAQNKAMQMARQLLCCCRTVVNKAS